MPMPKPNPNEEKEDFIKRFMGDSVMVREYPDAAQRRAIAEKQWERKERAYDEFVDKPQFYRVKNVPIFEAGIWKGGKLNYPVELVQKIVESAQELKDRIKPYIYLGHTGAKEPGQPAVGILENIRLKGKQVIADLADIPKQVFEMLQNKMYRRWSVEIAKDWKDTVTGKTHSRLLTGLALLGAEHPAVNTLPDTIDGYASLYYSDELEFDYCEVGIDEQEAIELDVHIIPQGGDNMDHEKEMAELREKLRTAEAKCQAAEDANVANVKEAQERVDAANAEVERVKTELANRDKSEVKRKIDDFIGEWKERGKILPAQEDLYRDKFERAEKLDEELQEWGKKLEGMPNLVELDEIAAKNRIEDQPDSVKREFFKDEFTSDMKSVGNRGPEDEAEIIEFAEVFANFKPGERAEHLEKCRENLRKEVLSYIK